MEIIFLSTVGTVGLLISEMLCYRRAAQRDHHKASGPRGGRRVPARHRAEWQPRRPALAVG
jgi:hypothetical protein